MCPKAEYDNAGLVGLVHAGELLRELALGDVRAAGVEDVDDELAAGKQPVREEFASAESDGRVGLVLPEVVSLSQIMKASSS